MGPRLRAHNLKLRRAYEHLHDLEKKINVLVPEVVGFGARLSRRGGMSLGDHSHRHVLDAGSNRLALTGPRDALKRLAVASCLVLTTVAGCRSEEPSSRPPATALGTTPVRPLVVQCDERISGGVIDEYPWRQQSVVAGPIAFWPAKSEFPELPAAALRPLSITRGQRRFAADQLKLQIIVDRGERAVIAIAPEARGFAAFLFRREFKPNGYLISEGSDALDVTACPDAGPHTEYSTALIVDGPRCLPFVVDVHGTSREIETILPVGVSTCPADSADQSGDGSANNWLLAPFPLQQTFF